MKCILSKNSGNIPLSTVKLWYNANIKDHFTSVTINDEKYAANNNYTLLAILGFVISYSNDTADTFQQNQLNYNPNLSKLNLYFNKKLNNHYSNFYCNENYFSNHSQLSFWTKPFI